MVSLGTSRPQVALAIFWSQRLTTMTSMFDIPPDIRAIILPSKETGILDLVQYPIRAIPPPNGPDLNATSDATLFSIIASLMQTPDQVSFVRGLPMPPRNMLVSLESRIQKSSSADPPWNSLAYPFHRNVVRLPFWVVTYWEDAYKLLADKELWSQAISWAKNQKKNLPLGVMDALRSLSWMHNLPHSRAEVRGVATLLSSQYISTDVIDELTGELSMWLENDGQAGLLRIPKTYLVLLGKAYQAAMSNNSNYQMPRCLERDGTLIQEGGVTKIYLVLGVLTANIPHCEATDLMEAEKRGNHYMAIVIDIKKRILFVGDSLGFWVPQEFVRMVEWWIQLYNPSDTFNGLRIEKLPCTTQSDNFSCGILAVNSLEHYFLSSTKLRTDGNDSKITARGDAFLLITKQKVPVIYSAKVLVLTNT